MIWCLKRCYYRVSQKLLKFFMRFMDWSDPVLLIGENAVLKLPKLIKERKINKVLIVTAIAFIFFTILYKKIN